MTGTICLWPIIAALSKALLFLNITVAPEQFTPINKMQREFIGTFYASSYDKLGAFNDLELRSWASRDVDALNSILKKERFDIQLEPFHDARSFGVVSILDVLVKWLEKGQKSLLNVDDKNYDAVKMDAGFDVWFSPNYRHPLLRVLTESGDKVWMTIADEPLEGFSLLKKIVNIKQNIQPENYDEAKFPMIDYNQKIDITWLCGLEIPNYAVKQALQQTKFKMNEDGAHVKSAVAIEMKCTCVCGPKSRKTVVIDKPFYLWIERPTKKFDARIKQIIPVLPLPVLAGYFDTDCWKNPGNLDL